MRPLPAEIAQYFEIATHMHIEVMYVPVNGCRVTFTDDENVGDWWEREHEVEYIYWTGKKWHISCAIACTHLGEFEASDKRLLNYLAVWPEVSPLYRGEKA